MRPNLQAPTPQRPAPPPGTPPERSKPSPPTDSPRHPRVEPATRWCASGGLFLFYTVYIFGYFRIFGFPFRIS
eukprot:406036-Prorocentrum_minimum.AAC.1